MFDWNDEELTNIIWDKAGESDDHIVPYPEATEDYCKKKQWSEGAGSIKSTELKLSDAKVDFHGRKLDSSSNLNLSGGTSSSVPGILSWSNLPSSNTAKTNQDSLDSSVSNSLIEFTKLGSSGNAETAQLNQESGIFQNPHEAKEEGDFADYGWANIGSFDDLDQIFSDDDTIFGNENLANADELWSSSKDVTNISAKSCPLSVESSNLGLEALRNTSGIFVIKTEYVQEDGQPFALGHGKGNDPVCHGLQSADGVLNNGQSVGDDSKPSAKELTDLTNMGRNSSENSHFTTENNYKQKKLSNSRKKLDNTIHQHLYCNWSSSGNTSGHFKDQYSAPMLQSSPSPVLGQQRQIPGHQLWQFQQLSNPFLAPSAYGGITNPYAAMPMVSHIQSREFKHQPLLSAFEASSGNANPINKMPKSPIKTQTMTPQEKIEKLRRRQQMQAMLAIQRKQRQFVHQVSCGDLSLSQKYPLENEIQNADGASVEVDELSTLPSFDLCSPIEQDNSNCILLELSDYLVEEKTLYRLQEIIEKLDVRIRLCIRDSLFRLAQSAIERQCASDTSSTNNDSMDGQLAVKDGTSRNRNLEMPEVETETNPIDRTVALLLFHRPLDLSGKPPGTPESPVSARLLSEHKTAGVPKLLKGCLSDTLKSEQNFSQHECKSSCPLADSHSIGQCNSSLCFDISENGSNSGPADQVVRELEASQ